VKVWEANWTEPMAQGIDFHEFYLHRRLNVWRLFNDRLPFFRAIGGARGALKAPPGRPTAPPPGEDIEAPRETSGSLRR
jgi:hypothetical protein